MNTGRLPHLPAMHRPLGSLRPPPRWQVVHTFVLRILTRIRPCISPLNGKHAVTNSGSSQDSGSRVHGSQRPHAWRPCSTGFRRRRSLSGRARGRRHPAQHRSSYASQSGQWPAGLVPVHVSLGSCSYCLRCVRYGSVRLGALAGACLCIRYALGPTTTLSAGIVSCAKEPRHSRVCSCAERAPGQLRPPSGATWGGLCIYRGPSDIYNKHFSFV